MNKKFAVIAISLLLIGGGAWFAIWWYNQHSDALPTFSDKDLARGAAVRDGEKPSRAQVTAGVLAIPMSRSVRLAIGGLGLRNDEKNSQVADLLIAELSRGPGLELIERKLLDKTLGEMAISLAGLMRAKEAVRAGKLLRADWFLLGNTVRLTQTNLIVARIVDAKTGVIVDVALVGDIDQPMRLAKALTDFTRRVRQTASRPEVREFLALGQFADASVNNRQASFPAQLRSYLMSAYQNSRTTLLEREYVDALLNEVRLDLAGLTAEASTNEVRPLQSAFWIVEGLFQSQESRGLEVEVDVRINRAFGRPTRHAFRGLPDENLFRQIKSAIDVELRNSRNVYPTRLSESRLQMFAGKDLYDLATGGRPMDVFPLGLSGFAPQEPSMGRRNLEEAIRAFQTVLLLEPDNLEAKWNIAMCCHEESVGRIEEARNYLRELASSTNYVFSQKALYSLGRSYKWEDSQEAAKWFGMAAAHAQNPRDAEAAMGSAGYSVADTIERNARRGLAPSSKDVAILIEQLEARLRSAESLLRGKGGGIDAWYGLENFANGFGNDRKAAVEQIYSLLPMIRDNFPALAPHFLGSAVTFLPDTNSPIYSEFLQSLESLREHPGELLGPEMYFRNLFLTAYDWCLDHGLYGLTVDLISIKRKTSQSIAQVKMDAKDGVRLGVAYFKSQDYTNALKAFEELGETPVVMEHQGVWGDGFTPFLPADWAAACRTKLGLATPTDDRRFDLGDPCLHLHANAVFAVEPSGLWLGIGRKLHHLSVDLQTNQTVSMPINSYGGCNDLCLEAEHIWIATAGDGLLEYNKSTGSMRQYTMKDGLLMDEITSLHIANERLWIGYGAEKETGESRGGLGYLDLAPRRFSSFTPALTSELIPPTYATGGRVTDPPDRPPRRPVVLIGSGPSRELVLNVAHAGIRRYLPDKDKWAPLSFQEQITASTFAANSEFLLTGLRIARYEVVPLDDSGPGQTNVAKTARKFLTEQQVREVRADRDQTKKIKEFGMVWLPALGIHESGSGSPQIVADDGGLPAYPQVLLLAGSDVIIGGEGYVLVYDLKQRRVRKLAQIATRSVDRIQLGAGYLWVQFGRHIYRTALSTIQDAGSSALGAR